MKNTTHNQLWRIAFIGICLFLNTLSANAEEIIVKAKGSKANGDFTHFHVFVNNLEIGSKHTSGLFEEYKFDSPFLAEEIKELKIVFDNDLTIGDQDRNLFICSITIGNQPSINPVNGMVKYYLQNGKEQEYNGMMGRNGELVFNLSAINQSPGNVTLRSQAEVDAFKCQCINGSLTISGEDIADLSPLAAITSVTGPLNIKNNPQLIVVSGMDALIEIGFLNVTNNPNLERIDGFNSMQKCGGIFVSENDKLKTIKCFHTPNL